MSTGGRLFAIGDVHGCVHALDALLEAILPNETDQLVFLGDLVDQGRDTKDVLERVLELKGRLSVVHLKGNHEEMMLAARDNEKALRYWEHCGGVATLNSYKFGARLSDVPDRHWALLEASRDYFETQEFLFAHANYLPDQPMEALPDHQLRWALFEPLEARPHFSGKTVVVGHTEQPNSEVLDLGFAICIDTACWRHGWLTALELPNRRSVEASRWGLLRAPREPTHRGKLPDLLLPATPTGAS